MFGASLAAGCDTHNAVHGRVTDAGGRPLPGASVVARDHYGVQSPTPTDTAGRFAAEFIPRMARATLLVCHRGYAPRRLEVTAADSLLGDVALMPAGAGQYAGPDSAAGLVCP